MYHLSLTRLDYISGPDNEQGVGRFQYKFLLSSSIMSLAETSSRMVVGVQPILIYACRWRYAGERRRVRRPRQSHETAYALCSRGTASFTEKVARL